MEDWLGVRGGRVWGSVKIEERAIGFGVRDGNRGSQRGGIWDILAFTSTRSSFVKASFVIGSVPF
jgi:hypothetical protein